MLPRQWPHNGRSASLSLSTGRNGSRTLLEEFSAIARKLGQADAEDRLVRMLASLVRASHEFIGIADLEGNALFVNEAGRKLVGLRDLEAVRSTRIVDYFASGDQPKLLQEVMPAVRSSGFWQGELRFRNFATGELVPVLYNIFPIYNASGSIAAYGTVTRDLSQSKLAEQRLQHLASIVELTEDAIVSKTPDGIITSWNKGAERVFGYTGEEVIGRSIIIVIPKDRQNEELEILARIKQGKRVDHFETVRLRKDGTLITVSLTVSPVRNAEGESSGPPKSPATSHSKRIVSNKSPHWLARRSTAARTCSRPCARSSISLTQIRPRASSRR